jgi:acetyltransferase EpsM
LERIGIPACHEYQMEELPRKVIIIGGLGNGSVIAAAIDEAAASGARDWTMAGYLNDRIEVGSDLEGHPVLGGLKAVRRFLDQDYYFLYTIYRIDGQNQRLALFEGLNLPDDRLAIFLYPKAYVATNAVIGPGCVVMPNASISSGAALGRCCLVMVNATIGHNTTIGDHGHIAACANLGAYLKVGRGVHIGLNATVRENLTLGDGSALGMGAVLLEDMGRNEIWAGNPARKLRTAKLER